MTQKVLLTSFVFLEKRTEGSSNIYPLIVQTPYMVHISKIIFYKKSIKYPFFHHFDFRNGFYRSKLVNRQHLGVAVGVEVADHHHWNALTSLIFAEWGLLSSLDNG